MATIRSESNGHVLEFIEGYSKEHKTKHVYVLDGNKIPGATDVKRGYPVSEGLIQYFIKQGIEEYKSGAKLKRQADIGTIMHDYAHALRLNLPFDMKKVEGHADEAKIRARMRLVDEFVGLSTDKVVKAEEIVASVKYQFGGKFDVLVERDGKLILQDYKSSKGFFEDHFLQAGGYSVAIQEWLGLKVDGLEIIRFADNAERPESFLVDTPSEIEEFQQQFIRCRQTREFQFKWKTFFEKKYREANPWSKSA